VADAHPDDNPPFSLTKADSFTLQSGGVVELVGPLAASALAHPRVTVVAMPHPEIPSACDVATMEVQSVVAAS
jgi:hypothetical protein